MGGVVDGTPVDAATTNPAFLDANGDDTALGKINLNNATDPSVSGTQVVNIQREFNSLSVWIGKALNLAFNTLPNWINSQGFTASQSVGDRAEALSEKFHNVTGHSHGGAPGDGGFVEAVSLINVKLRGSVLAASLISTASGGSTDVSTNFTGKTPSAGDLSKGVVVIAPNNKVLLRQGSGPNSGDEFVDGFGNVVYGRLSFAISVWTLTYFVDLSGVETAYSFSSPVNIQLYYQELFNPITDAPIYSEYAVTPSDNATADVIDATATLRGLISAGIQTLGGNKTWNGTQLFQAMATYGANAIFQARLFFSTVTDSATTGALATLPVPSKTTVLLTNVSLVSIQEISGGADGAFFLAINSTGTDLVLKNETGTIGNQVRTGTGGDFTWKSKASIIFYFEATSGFWYLTGGGSPFSLAAVGAVPNANGASYNAATGAFNLQPADTSFPGVMTVLAQSFTGAKTWLGNAIFQAILRLDTQTDNSTTGSSADLPAPVRGILRLTNPSLVSIQRILTMANEQVSILINKTGASITLINDFGANGFLTGSGSDLTVQNNASVWLTFDSISSRVMVVGGSGGGSGGGAAAVQAVTASASLTNLPTTPRRIVLVDATPGSVTLTLPPAAANTIGTEWIFKRIDTIEANIVTIQRAGADTIDEGNSQTLPYQWSRTSIRGLSATSWGVF